LTFRAEAHCFEVLTVPDQGPVLALAGGRAVGLGDLSLGDLLGQDEGVVVVGLLLAVGDLVDLRRVGQDDPVGEGFEEFDEPLVACGGLDDRLEGAEAAEELEDALGSRSRRRCGERRRGSLGRGRRGRSSSCGGRCRRSSR
jgi:hypothetical protein